MQHPDICIAGAGIIGLSLAIELRRRGHRVIVFDQGAPLSEASTAAAGMLAPNDPENPPQLGALADLSLSLYPAFIERIHELSGVRVPFQTCSTLQALPSHLPVPEGELTSSDLMRLLPALNHSGYRFILLDEHSLDPRQLASSLLAAVRATTIDLRSNTRVLSVRTSRDHVEIRTAQGQIEVGRFVDCSGAWAASTSPLTNLRVSPKKGQMLYVALPSSLPLALVVRTNSVYIVPRLTGPNLGRALIGATVEDAGFDKSLHPSDIAHLQSLAAELLPALAQAQKVEAWAGLRPATRDHLPILGAMSDRSNHLLATGHYRNGILLAPATAHLIAQLLSGETPTIDLAPFSPSRVIAGFG